MEKLLLHNINTIFQPETIVLPGKPIHFTLRLQKHPSVWTDGFSRETNSVTRKHHGKNGKNRDGETGVPVFPGKPIH